MEMINGNGIAQQILTKLMVEVKKFPFTPLFCDVIIGEDPVAQSYVKIKARRAEEIGLKFKLIQLPSSITTLDVVVQLKKIQQDPFLAGLIVQLPLPAQLDKFAILNAIDPRVDVDCLNAENAKSFYVGSVKLLPPTAAAVVSVLDSLKLDLKLLNILVIGQGELVGKPVTALLKNRGLAVTTSDNSTSNLKDLTSIADIIISATGQAKLITGNMIKSGVVLIDCGTSESAGSIVGDIDTESVAEKARYLAPVPGGIGPVTVAMLLQNVVEVAKDLE